MRSACTLLIICFEGLVSLARYHMRMPPSQVQPFRFAVQVVPLPGAPCPCASVCWYACFLRQCIHAFVHAPGSGSYVTLCAWRLLKATPLISRMQLGLRHELARSAAGINIFQTTRSRATAMQAHISTAHDESPHRRMVLLSMGAALVQGVGTDLVSCSIFLVRWQSTGGQCRATGP